MKGTAAAAAGVLAVTSTAVLVVYGPALDGAVGAVLVLVAVAAAAVAVALLRKD